MISISQLDRHNIAQPIQFTINKSSINNWDYIFNVIVLYFLSGAILYHIVDEQDLQSNSLKSSAIKYFWYFMYCLIIYKSSTQYYKILKALAQNKLLILLSSFVIISALWSQATDVTLRRSLSYCICIIYAIYLKNKFPQEKILILFFHLSWVIMITSILCIILLPEYGIANGVHKGSWQGVYFHKNALGRICSICLLSTLLYMDQQKKYNFSTFLLAALSFLLIIMSKSTTSLIAILVLYPLYIFLKLLYKNYKPYKSVITYLLFSLLIYLIYVLANYSDYALGALGKDDSFSGRLPLWTMLIDYIYQSPIYGYGYSAFWIPNLLSKNLWSDVNWNPQQGHNGFLDITLELGLVGLGIFLLFFIKGYSRAINSIKNNINTYSYWNILTLFFLTIVSFSESFLLKYNNIYWIIFVICCTSIKPKNKSIILNKNNIQ